MRQILIICSGRGTRYRGYKDKYDRTFSLEGSRGEAKSCDSCLQSTSVVKVCVWSGHGTKQEPWTSHSQGVVESSRSLEVSQGGGVGKDRGAKQRETDSMSKARKQEKMWVPAKSI